MNDGGGDGAGCFDIKEWADTTELTNVEVAGLGLGSVSVYSYVYAEGPTGHCCLFIGSRH